MARRRHLIAYDIADPHRLRRVCTVMEAYGQRLQYSVFLCDLSRAERSRWHADVLAVMNLGEDSIVEIDLGPTASPAPLTVIGVPRQLPRSGPTIV
ncbi:MAG: CRISPR-associated endonuclease Cas2 [Kineosporiaceae bacterium]